MNEKRVGRPVQKIGRKKIGLSLDGITTDMIEELCYSLGKTKSRIVEEAIMLYYKNNQKIEVEFSKISKEKSDPYYKLKDMLANSRRED